MNNFDYEQLLNCFNISNGDIVDVASDMFSIYMNAHENNEDFDFDSLLNSLIRKVGNDGTLMIRTFSWDFCNGKSFNIKNSPSRTGTLGDIALKKDGFLRTRHPIYSWAVYGKHRDFLISLNNKSSFSEDSPFNFLYKKRGKQITIGNTKGVPDTQLHYAEQTACVCYRKEKDFEAEYIGYDCKKEIKTYSMFVRPSNIDVNNDPITLKQYSDILCNKNIEIVNYYRNLKCITINLKEYTDFVIDDILNNDGKTIVSVNGKLGYKNNDVDWSSAIF